MVDFVHDAAKSGKIETTYRKEGKQQCFTLLYDGHQGDRNSQLLLKIVVKEVVLFFLRKLFRSKKSIAKQAIEELTSDLDLAQAIGSRRSRKGKIKAAALANQV